MHVGSVSWRDLRNRWRVQLAVVLLGNARVRVEDVAREVGYASGPALARALAAHGLPNAREIRRRFREADGSESDIGA
jgi:transcriptional regulator GlxA family with amidase domain